MALEKRLPMQVLYLKNWAAETTIDMEKEIAVGDLSDYARQLQASVPGIDE